MRNTAGLLVHYVIYLLLLFSFFGENFACKWVQAITTRNVTLKVTGAGLHRQLIVDTSVGSSNRFIDCHIAYRFVIPSGAYIDMDSLPTMGNHRIAKTYFDVEAPQQRSVDTAVYVCSKSTIRKNFVFNEHLQFPFHLRYHAPSGQDAIVKLSIPRLLIKCPQNATFLNEKNCSNFIRKAPCDCVSNTKCDWIILSAQNTTSIQLSIPTGDPSLRPLVLIVTFALIFAATFAIIFASFVGSEKQKSQ